MNDSVRNEAKRIIAASREASPEARMAVDRCQLAVITGSHAYGNATPQSDVDVRGFFLANPEFYFGAKTVKVVDKGVADDIAMYEAKHFFVLLTQANPNIIEVLFTPEDCIVQVGPLGEELLAMRREFLTKRCLYSFSGYGFAQLKRIERHLQWIENPPVEPDPAPYMITRYRNKGTGKVIPIEDFEQKKARAARLSRTGSAFMREEQWEKVEVPDAEPYKRARREWDQYQEWVKHRNPQRAELERQYGYDTKHASHLIRLLLQCRHILVSRDLPVRLDGDDLQTVRDVRSGKLSYNALMEKAIDLEAQLHKLATTASIPSGPDIDGLSRRFADAAIRALV